MKKNLIMIAMVVFTILLTGCSANNVYTTLSDAYELSDDELKALTEQRLSMRRSDNGDYGLGDIDADVSGFGQKAKSGVYTAVSSVCSWAKHYGIITAVVSAFIGFIIMRLARKSINIRRKALFILVLGIPFFIIVVLMYGSAFLADSLL